MKVGFPVRNKYFVFFSLGSRPVLEKHGFLENTRRVRKVKIQHVYADREIFMHIMATLPSTLIL